MYFYAHSTGAFYSSEIHSSIPADAVQTPTSVYRALLDGLSKGQVIGLDPQGQPVLQDPPAASQQQLIATYTNAVQRKLDSAASQWGYDTIGNAVTYAEEPAVPKFQQEGQAFRAWRSACWDYCYTQLNAITSGHREMPSIDQLIAELPPLELGNV